MEHMGKNAKTELSVDPQVNDAVENKEQFCRKWNEHDGACSTTGWLILKLTMWFELSFIFWPMLRCCRDFTEIPLNAKDENPVRSKAIPVNWVKQLDVAHNGYGSKLGTPIVGWLIFKQENCICSSQGLEFCLSTMVTRKHWWTFTSTMLWMAPWFQIRPFPPWFWHSNCMVFNIFVVIETCWNTKNNNNNNINVNENIFLKNIDC